MIEVQLSLKIKGGQKEVDDLLSLLYDHLGQYAQLESFTTTQVDEV